MPMNSGSETGEFLALMATLEHDDPEHAPTYEGKPLVRVGDVLMTQETAAELAREAA
jgi:ribosomal protein S28E/S33